MRIHPHYQVPFYFILLSNPGNQQLEKQHESGPNTFRIANMFANPLSSPQMRTISHRGLQHSPWPLPEAKEPAIEIGTQMKSTIPRMWTKGVSSTLDSSMLWLLPLLNLELTRAYWVSSQIYLKTILCLATQKKWTWSSEYSRTCQIYCVESGLKNTKQEYVKKCQGHTPYTLHGRRITYILWSSTKRCSR